MSLFTFFWRMRFKWKSKKDNSVSVNCCFFVTFWYFLIIFFVLSFQIIKIKLIWKKNLPYLCNVFCNVCLVYDMSNVHLCIFFYWFYNFSTWWMTGTFFDLETFQCVYEARDKFVPLYKLSLVQNTRHSRRFAPFFYFNFENFLFLKNNKKSSQIKKWNRALFYAKFWCLDHP